MSLHLKILFFLTFTQGIFQSFGVPFNLLKLIQEAYIILIFLFFFNLKKIELKYGIYVYAYMILVFLSALYNDNSVISAILYSRFHFYALLIFLISKSYNWKLKEVKSQYSFLKKMLALQVLYAFYEIFILKDVQEEIVGTITTSGGELATIIPLVGLCFFFVEYLFNSKKKILLLMCLSLILIGFASAKRGVIFYFPITFVIIYLLYLKYEKIPTYKRLPKIVFVSIFALILFVIGVSNNKSLNSGNSTSGRYALEYASNYTTAKSYDGKIIGRIGASLQIIYQTGSNGVKDWIGFGPEILMGKSGDFELYKIDYGIVGWTKEVISVGWFGMIFYWLFYYRIFRKIYKKRKQYYGTIYKQFYLSVLSFFIIFTLMFFTYSASFSVSGVLSFYLMLFIGILWNVNQPNLTNDIKA